MQLKILSGQSEGKLNSYIRYSLRKGMTRPILELLEKVMPVATRGYDYCPILI